MSRWLIVTASALVVVMVWVGVLLLRDRAPARSWVERRGATLIVHGRGADAELGHLAAGRYKITIDENQNGCADSLSLFGEDGVEWYRLNPHLINIEGFATTRPIPGQRYRMHVDALNLGGLGPRTTPTPVSNCSWVFELAPA